MSTLGKKEGAANSRGLQAMGNSRKRRRRIEIVAIGASAGGIEACRTFLDAMPANSGMACILVQHLEPNHESLMVGLLADHTSMPVLQATDGLMIEPDHVYIIPPGTYLAVKNGALRITQSSTSHGIRLPIDHLLVSLASECGSHCVCVILTGTGEDGSGGLTAIHDAGGLVIVQDPEEVEYKGMPRAAIATQKVDLVLKVADIPGAIISGRIRPAMFELPELSEPSVHRIVEYIRNKTGHDFHLYKQGTVLRRIQRRMAMTGAAHHDIQKYIDLLERDPEEVNLLANDLLINVTCFFRDQKAFELLETLVIPELMTGHDHSQPLRIWCPGCSTGEEAYSIAILFHEAFELAGKSLRLQIFASDLDTDAIAIAREGLYADTIALDMSPQRLAKNFTKEGIKYKVHPDLRLAVVFTVQNVLADPPFSRLDLLSCRNLLIYLQPDAQARASAIFHFSLRAGGFLLLGNSETVGGDDGRFQLLSKTERLYRHTGRVRPGEFPFQLSINEGGRDLGKTLHPSKPLKEEALLGRYQRIVLEEYSAAAILIDSKLEVQFSSGPTERYLQFPKGVPTRDIVSMAKMDLRGRLRSAIHRCFKEEKVVSFSATQASLRGSGSDFQVELQPLQHNNQKYQLICFIDRPSRKSDGKDESSVSQSPRINELESELESVRI